MSSATERVTGAAPSVGIPTRTLADLLEPGTKDAQLHFLDEGIALNHRTLWADSGSVAAWHRRQGRPFATVLTNTSSCVKVLMGAIRTGATLVSLPLPPRGADAEWYTAFVQNACRQTGVDMIAIDAALVDAMPPVAGLTFVSHDEILSTTGGHDFSPENFTLVQFTSGSTSDPRGVVLPQHKIATNVTSILERLDPRPGDVGCSWLPLSHDMGLIGMLLAGVAGLGDDWARGGALVVMRPESFLLKPGKWLNACSEFGATITAAPDFGFNMALRLSSSSLDLRRLRVCITGGELVRPETLNLFAAKFKNVGFDERAFCPAYGLAEAVLAVAMTHPDARWESRTLDVDELIEGALKEAEDGVEVVSAGALVARMEVKIAGGDGAIGIVSVRGPSLSSEFSDGRTTFDPETGWLTTSDLGFMQDDQLFIVGRADDVINVGARKIYALDVEAAINDVAGIRRGRAVAVPVAGPSFAIIAEPENSEVDVEQLVSDIRTKVVRRVGLTPRQIAIIPRGRLPMTASGKIRRREVSAKIAAGSLEVLKLVDLGS